MKKKQIIISGIALFLITITLLGLTYAYYKTKVIGNSNEKTISSVGKKLEIIYADENGVIEAAGIEPGYTVTKTFSVKNTGDDTATYSIKLDNIINTFTRTEDWTYVLKEGNTEINKGTIPTYETTLLDSVEIESGVTKSYSLVVTYANLTDVDQSIDMGSTLSIRVNIADAVKNSVTFIGNGNSIENYRIYGNSIQRGIPTPDNPVEIESVGDKTKNLFDPNILIEQGWTKEEDGSYYIENNRTIYKKKLWENTEGYTGQIRVNYKVKYLKGYEESIAPGSIIRIVYTDGTLKSVAFISGKWSKEWQDVNWNTISDADKIVEYVEWNYGTGDNSTWVKDIMITKDVESDEYEPYGYKIPITLTGKNLWNIPEEFTFNCYKLEIELQPGTYKIVADSMYVDDKEMRQIYVRFQKNQKGFYLKKTQTITLTTKEDIIYFYSYGYDYINSLNHTAKINKLMLIKENEDSTYEPYKETTTNIYLDEPLRKIGDYADYIDFKEQKIVRKISKEKIDGTEEWNNQENTTNNFQIFYTNKYKNNVLYTRNALSNKFKNISSRDLQDAMEAYTIQTGLNDGAVYISLPKTIASNPTEVQKFFKNNLTEYYYISKNSNINKVNLPEILTNDGVNKLSIKTVINPSNIEIDEK